MLAHYLDTNVCQPKRRSLQHVSCVCQLYDAASVASFSYTVSSRVVQSLVREQQSNGLALSAAVGFGETAALFEEPAEAADVFTISLGNVPADESVTACITYLASQLGRRVAAEEQMWSTMASKSQSIST